MDSTGHQVNSDSEGQSAESKGQGGLIHSDADRLQLLSKLLLGLAIIGSENLIERLRQYQGEIEAHPKRVETSLSGEEENGEDLLRYLAVGILARGRNRVVDGVRRGFRFSFRAANRTYGVISTLTDNPLTRPLRRPVDSFVENWQDQAKELVSEGRSEELSSRWMAQQTVDDMIDDLIDYISENPEVTELISDMIGQQSLSMAGVVVDNSRRVTLAGDNALEGVIRRVFRMKPRAELPQSPLVGKPQEMYVHQEQEALETEERK